MAAAAVGDERIIVSFPKGGSYVDAFHAFGIDYLENVAAKLDFSITQVRLPRGWTVRHLVVNSNDEKRFNISDSEGLPRIFVSVVERTNFAIAFLYSAETGEKVKAVYASQTPEEQMLAKEFDGLKESVKAENRGHKIHISQQMRDFVEAHPEFEMQERLLTKHLIWSI